MITLWFRLCMLCLLDFLFTISLLRLLGFAWFCLARLRFAWLCLAVVFFDLVLLVHRES